MTKIIALFIIISCSSFTFISLDNPSSPNPSSNGTSSTIKSIFQKISFSKSPLSFEIFEKAYVGYVNLKKAGMLPEGSHILTICDFTKSSTENRFWVIDLNSSKVLYNTLVAHGQGSGMEYATQFSNNDNSHQSSIGFYLTGETYQGEHGLSCHLRGMDNGYNSAAFDRGIVIHGADYVCKDFISSNSRLGRSWGCPALPSALSSAIINTIKNNNCLFIYYPSKKYLTSCVWLKNTNTFQIQDPTTNYYQQFINLSHDPCKNPQVVFSKS